VEKGVNVFMEKSFAVDPPGVRRLIKAGEAAEKKNLKIAAGLMCRHSRNRQELIRRLRDGQLGEIQFIRAYRMCNVRALRRKPAGEKELLWQIRNFTDILWVAGGRFAEANIHQIDEICWIKDGWPVSAHGVGGRAANNLNRLARFWEAEVKQGLAITYVVWPHKPVKGVPDGIVEESSTGMGEIVKTRAPDCPVLCERFAERRTALSMQSGSGVGARKLAEQNC